MRSTFFHLQSLILACVAALSACGGGGGGDGGGIPNFNGVWSVQATLTGESCSASASQLGLPNTLGGTYQISQNGTQIVVRLMEGDSTFVGSTTENGGLLASRSYDAPQYCEGGMGTSGFALGRPDGNTARFRFILQIACSGVTVCTFTWDGSAQRL